MSFSRTTATTAANACFSFLGMALSATVLTLNGLMSLPFARIYSEAPEGAPFWYENSQGLVEIAVNRGSAAGLLGLNIGDSLAWA